MKNLNFLKASSLLMVALVIVTFLFTSTNTTNSSNEQIIAELSEKIAKMDKALEEVKVAEELVVGEPFIGEITLFGGNFLPRGYMFCEGQLLDIYRHESLFSILGTTYGGDGRTTFALPDLRGRAAVQKGQGPGLERIELGQRGGLEQINVSILNVSQDGGNNTQVASRIGKDNRVPYLGMNYIIAVNGTYPSRE